MTEYFPERRFDPPNPEYFSIWFHVVVLVALVVFTILTLNCLSLLYKRARRNQEIIATRVAEVELQPQQIIATRVAGVELQPHREEAVGVDPDLRQRIPHIIYRTNSELPYEEEKCACCQFEYMVGESVCIIPSCRHSFHSSCFSDYMSRSAVCPCCRRRISLDQPLEDRTVAVAV